jgi:hypothetical protein
MNNEAQIRFNLVMAHYQKHGDWPTADDIKKIETQVAFIFTGNSSGLVRAAGIISQ